MSRFPKERHRFLATYIHSALLVMMVREEKTLTYLTLQQTRAVHQDFSLTVSKSICQPPEVTEVEDYVISREEN